MYKRQVKDGLNDVQMSFKDIKKLNQENRVCCFVGNFIAENYINQGHLGALLTEVDETFYGVPSARYEAACASSSVALDAAITKLRAGDYDVAIVVGLSLIHILPLQASMQKTVQSGSLCTCSLFTG